MNILITSAGQRVSLVNSFKKELTNICRKGSVFTTDLNPELAPACHISDKSFKVPKVTDDKYIVALLNICLDNNVKMIVPTIDTELHVLSLNIDNFKKKGIDIIVSGCSFVEICRDKRKVNDLFVNKGIDIPKQFDLNELSFPVFVKPYDGSRSEGIFTAFEPKDITDQHLDDKKLMFMEYVPSEDYDEFTIDCYYDKKSQLRCVVPRKRIHVRAGEVNKGVTKNNFIVKEFQEKLSILEGAKGCLTIQVFLHKSLDVIKGIEINPRFGGGYPLTYLAGANYTKWLIEEYLLNRKIDYFDEWEDNLLMLRYDAEVLVSDYQQ
ncbi:ATP-grasp domain-containing protein [uncultured Psychrobacter sp.]|uniref:ATP-grasp domain-containing protein n=1 Tax=uncultured Psychrobacter sp. TaxID=259303 RepID=UPI0026306078|nr:ATP-grasp domain-containing protein [uncultured Psychrobacter sp.]